MPPLSFWTVLFHGDDPPDAIPPPSGHPVDFVGRAYGPWTLDEEPAVAHSDSSFIPMTAHILHLPYLDNPLHNPPATVHQQLNKMQLMRSTGLYTGGSGGGSGGGFGGGFLQPPPRFTAAFNSQCHSECSEASTEVIVRILHNIAGPSEFTLESVLNMLEVFCSQFNIKELWLSRAMNIETESNRIVIGFSYACKIINEIQTSWGNIVEQFPEEE
ncbi:hypothetical protein R3P38DRAFT_2763575 [Favolaschia claudopus]|uniref:Uncharacterized protein n=1 Tax=Favolaschia claudopus TaxID=2862362 RepID=A0AAW0DGZ9_9AGAR